MSGFGAENLPYGVFTVGDEAPRLGTRWGDSVVDLTTLASDRLLPAVLESPSLDALLRAGRFAWDEVRQAMLELFSNDDRHDAIIAASHQLSDVRMHLPFTVGDYVDFYSSEPHATNIGKIFRPDAEPLLPNWKHLPVGYHGRSSTIVVSGTPIRRPVGQRRGFKAPVFGPSERMDIELEMGFVVGGSSTLGRPIPIDNAADHIFGMVLLNDWSSRDIQAWEYQPLGPFLGKSFASSISPWVVPMAALEPFRLPGPPQDPEPFEYLQADEPWAVDVDLAVYITTPAMRETGMKEELITATNFKDMYWTMAQQLAHMTSNGAIARAGDFCGSGTISGSAPGTYGSLIELSWNGAEPIVLANGEQRSFLMDGDEIVIRGMCQRADLSVSFGEVSGTIIGS